MATKKIEFGIGELLNRLDVSEETIKLATDGKLTEEVFNKDFEGTWISIEQAKSDSSILDPAIQKRDGEIFTEFQELTKRGFNTLGLDLSKDDLKPEGRKIKANDLIGLLVERAGARIEDLKENAGKDNSEKVSKLEKKLEDVTGQVTHFKTEFNNKSEAFDKLEKESESNLNDYKITTKLNADKNSITYTDKITDLDRIGFDTVLGGLKKELDENDNLVLKTPEGEEYWNEAKTEILPSKEVVLKLANDFGLVKKNTMKLPANGAANGFVVPAEQVKREVKNKDRRAGFAPE